MMVMTRVSERPVTDPAGTIGAVGALRAARRVRGSPTSPSERPLANPVRPLPGCARSAWKRSAASRVRGPDAGAPGHPGDPGDPEGLSNDPDMAVVQLQARCLG